MKDIAARAKIRVKLDRVRLGNLGDSRSVGGGVHELRVNYGPGYRLYYVREGNNVILLLLGGDKSKQEKDITMAREFWNDHKRRAKNA